MHHLKQRLVHFLSKVTFVYAFISIVIVFNFLYGGTITWEYHSKVREKTTS